MLQGSRYGTLQRLCDDSQSRLEPTLTETTPSISRARTGCYACLALCLGVGAGLLLAEGVVRFWFREVPPNLLSERQFYRPSENPLRVYEPIPGFQGPDGERINEHGLRGPETTLAKPNGVYRIAVLGDSYTFGQSVPEPEIWVRRVQTLLNRELERRGSAVRAEVLNFGVPGYNTKNQLGSLELALGFEPDLVLVAHLINDDLWDILRVSYGTLVFQSEADLDEIVPLPRSVKRGLYRRSLLYRLAATHLLRKFHRRELDEFGTGPVLEQALEGWRHDEDGIDAPRLKQIFETSRGNGADVAVVQIPLTRPKVQTERTPEEAKVTDSLRDLAIRHDVPMLDLFPVLRGLDGREFQVAPGDSHPNAELHGLYAERIVGWLLETFTSSEAEAAAGGV